MPERVLSKPRKKRRKQQGKVVRLSPLVLEILDEQRFAPNNNKLSYDAILRRHLGLPDAEAEPDWRKAGRPKLLVEGWIEQRSARFFASEAEARGAMVLAAAQARTKRMLRPLRVKEILWA